jgi:hypothetical protein
MNRTLALLLALLCPVLVVGSGAPGVTTLALVAVAIAALVGLAGGAGGTTIRTRVVVPASGRAVPLVLYGRVVDPVAHPRRPRAPGRG